MSTPNRLALALTLSFWVLIAAHADGPINPTPLVDLSQYAKLTDLSSTQATIMSAMPTPYTGVPPGPSGAGVTANNNQFVPSGAAQRQGVQRTTAFTDASGNFSVNWNWSFTSTTPTVTTQAGNPGGTLPIICNWQTRSQSAITGRCWQTTLVSLTLAIVTAGLSLNVFAGTPAVNTPVSVIMAEPTQ